MVTHGNYRSTTVTDNKHKKKHTVTHGNHKKKYTVTHGNHKKYKVTHGNHNMKKLLEMLSTHIHIKYAKTYKS